MDQRLKAKLLKWEYEVEEFTGYIDGFKVRKAPREWITFVRKFGTYQTNNFFEAAIANQETRLYYSNMRVAVKKAWVNRDLDKGIS